jgi:cytochrome c553
MKRKLLTISILIVSIALCSLTLPDEPKFKNLKVLNKNISHDELDSIMKNFKNSLGVKCSFCHAQRKDDPKKLDFASDDNKHKLISRDMMRMTMKINKKYFKSEKQDAITCYTCHNGHKEPVPAPAIVEEE